MVLKGNALYVRALIGGSLGFVTFGWDAGVLGGVLLTNEFQSAMGVSSRLFCILPNWQLTSLDYSFQTRIPFP